MVNTFHKKRICGLEQLCFNGREGQPTTAVWRNGRFSTSYDSFVVSSRAALRLNFCAKIPYFYHMKNNQQRLSFFTV